MTAPIRHVPTADARAALKTARDFAQARLLNEDGTMCQDAGLAAAFVAHVNALADVLAERDHHAAHVTELQCGATAALEENRRLRRELADARREGGPPLRIKRMGSVATPEPRRAHPGDAGLDLCAAIGEVDFRGGGAWSSVPHNGGRVVTIGPGARVRIGTGWAVEIPHGYEGQIRGRSGLTDKGIIVGLGTIDAAYRGELKMQIHNVSDEPFTIAHGERVAQLVISPVVLCSVEVVETLSESDRGANGFGSTGM